MTISETPAPALRRRPKDRREQILAHAFSLIAEAGFNAVSLADVADACGIRKSSVLYHFPSMNDLLLEVLAVREAQDYAFYLSLPQGSGPAIARDRVTRLFERNLERRELVRLYTILTAESLAPEHPAHEYFSERVRQARAELARSLDWKPEPELAAAELLAFWDGLELNALHDTDLNVRAVWDSFCDRFFV